MVKGGNTFVPSVPLRIAVRHGLDATALLLDDGGSVRGDGDIVFHGQPAHPCGAVRLTDGDEGTEWLEVDLPGLEPEVARVLVIGSTEVGSLRDVREPSVEAFAPDGTSVVRYEVARPAGETALVFAELYRRAGGWKFRAVGQGYLDGLAGLARDHGVDVAEEDAPPASRDPRPTPAAAGPVAEPPPVAPSPAPHAPAPWTFGPDFEPYEQSGRDNGVVTAPVPAGPVIVELSVEGEGYTCLDVLDARNGNGDNLVNSTQPDYRGRLLAVAPEERPLRLRLEAEGRWQVRVLPLTHARRLGEPLEGYGPEVLLHTAGTADLTVRYSGGENLILNTFEVAGRTGLPEDENLLNEIGRRTETVPLPPGPLLVQLEMADGHWSMALAPVDGAPLPAPLPAPAPVDTAPPVRKVPGPPAAPMGAAPPGGGEPAAAEWDFGPVFTPYEETGHDGGVVTAEGVPTGPVIVELAVEGRGYTGLFVLDRRNNERDTLVNSTHPNFRGRLLTEVPEDGPLRLKVRAEGRWRLRVLPLAHGLRLGEPLRGDGPEVLLHTAGTADLTVHYKGDSNLIADVYQVRGHRDLPTNRKVLNEIGKRKETLPLPEGPVIVQFSMAEGPWTMELKHVAPRTAPAAGTAVARTRHGAPAPGTPGSAAGWSFGPSFPVFEKRGVGKQVVTARNVPAGPVLVEFTHDGSGYVGACTLSRWNREEQRLFSESIPQVRITAPAVSPRHRPLRVRVEADGTWTLRVLPLSAARTLGADTLCGEAPEALLYTGPAADLHFDVKARMGAYTQLVCYEVDGAVELPEYRLLISEGGRLSTVVPLPPGPLLLGLGSVDGPWKMTAHPSSLPLAKED
ncbi:TerD family protein [Streptomyces sp. LE64]|uniref:TerD family protein n=1 Tax=Streptomyces sp. LE64 TaxID=3448653 RepID=UPI0040416602